MRATFSRLVLAATAATSAVAFTARPAAAQQPARPAARLASYPAPSSGAEVRAVAVYRLVAVHASGIPAQVVISDSAGRLVAAYRLRDGSRSYPMMVDVSGAGMVLQGETPQGVLTLYLYDPSTSSQGGPDGHWWLGEQEGELRGRVLR